MEQPKGYVSDILYHFWGGSNELAFNIFKSISLNGFLLTKGTNEVVDSFPCEDENENENENGNVNEIFVVQNARVCLTDIPERHIAYHCKNYGGFGVGVNRESVLKWGGLPVWYLTNHHVPNTLQGHTGGLVWGLNRAHSMLSSSQLPKDRQAAGLLLAISSYFKEMSSKKVDDHKYLYEREWRIVSGIISSKFGNVFRGLDPKERSELLNAVPEWGQSVQTKNDNVNNQIPDELLIDSFCYFNGVTNEDTIAKNIIEIIVPSFEMKDKVKEYIRKKKDLFGEGTPRIKVKE